MSAPDDSSTPAAAAATATADSRHGQPEDAVAMESMPKTDDVVETAAQHPVSKDDDGDDDKNAAAPNTNESSERAAGKAPEPLAAAAADDDDAPATSDDAAPAPPSKERQDSIAIGPAEDDIKAVGQGDDSGPICNINLLLTSGSRHPYKISARYLSRRNVPIPETTESGQPDPFSISIYTLKELILREWRSDWETKPASPGSIRLIHFGKLLDDKETLKSYQFLPESPNVVHMSIRPPDLDEEEPRTGGKAASQGGGDVQRRRAGGCCVVL